MKKKNFLETIIFLAAILITPFSGSAQPSIHNSQQIGQTARNQNVSRGFWVKSDTALFTSKIWIPGDSAGAGMVFTSDANGFGTWVSPSLFSLTNGSGTTANGTAVDLGGVLNQPTAIVQNENPFVLYDPSDDGDRIFLVGNGSIFGLADTTVTIIGYNSLNVSTKVVDFTGADGIVLRGGEGQLRMVNNAGFSTQNSLFETGYYGINGGSDTGGLGFSNIYQLNLRTGRDISNWGCDIENFTPSLTAFVNQDTSGEGYLNSSLRSEYNYWRFDVSGHNPTVVGQATKRLLFHADSGLLVRTASQGIIYRVDTFGIITFGSLDSVTAYAKTPSNGSKVYCSDCTGNGVTGRFISFIGGAWRREVFE